MFKRCLASNCAGLFCCKISTNCSNCVLTKFPFPTSSTFLQKLVTFPYASQPAKSTRCNWKRNLQKWRLRESTYSAQTFDSMRSEYPPLVEIDVILNVSTPLAVFAGYPQFWTFRKPSPVTILLCS